MRLRNFILSKLMASEEQSRFLIFIYKYMTEIKTLVYSLLIYLQMDTMVSLHLMILLGIDTVLGIVKSIVIKELEFDLKSFWFGIVTKMLILLIPAVFSLVMISLGQNMMWAIDFTLKALVVSEGLSCLTNIASIKTKTVIKNKDFISIILKNLRLFLTNLLTSKLKELIEDDKDEKK